MPNCIYYQAKVSKPETWFLIATLRSFEHCVFDRTLDKENGILEFFLPEYLEPWFLECMDYYKKHTIVFSFSKMQNRLLDPKQEV
jgi:hypothetical protein